MLATVNALKVRGMLGSDSLPKRCARQFRDYPLPFEELWVAVSVACMRRGVSIPLRDARSSSPPSRFRNVNYPPETGERNRGTVSYLPSEERCGVSKSCTQCSLSSPWLVDARVHAWRFVDAEYESDRPIKGSVEIDVMQNLGVK